LTMCAASPTVEGDEDVNMREIFGTAEMEKD